MLRSCTAAPCARPFAKGNDRYSFLRVENWKIGVGGLPLDAAFKNDTILTHHPLLSLGHSFDER